jgi:hypothetical protein
MANGHFFQVNFQKLEEDHTRYIFVFFMPWKKLTGELPIPTACLSERHRGP